MVKLFFIPRSHEDHNHFLNSFPLKSTVISNIKTVVWYYATKIAFTEYLSYQLLTEHAESYPSIGKLHLWQLPSDSALTVATGPSEAVPFSRFVISADVNSSTCFSAAGFEDFGGFWLVGFDAKLISTGFFYIFIKIVKKKIVNQGAPKNI